MDIKELVTKMKATISLYEGIKKLAGKRAIDLALAQGTDLSDSKDGDCVVRFDCKRGTAMVSVLRDDDNEITTTTEILTFEQLALPDQDWKEYVRQRKRSLDREAEVREQMARLKQEELANLVNKNIGGTKP